MEMRLAMAIKQEFLLIIFVACSFSISPIMELSTFRLAITFDHYQNGTDVEHTAVTSMTNNSLTAAIVVATNYIKQPVNSSLCQITSLEVYRGRRNITRISHDGFFLSDEGIFKVFTTVTLYACMIVCLRNSQTMI